VDRMYIDELEAVAVGRNRRNGVGIGVKGD
jgi:hypothetical protein